MAANVLLPGVAADVPIKACHGLDRADFQRLAEHVAGRRRPAASIAAIVSEHAFSSVLRITSADVMPFG
jgi:hypothetical protein